MIRFERLESRDVPAAPDWGVPVEVAYGDFDGDGRPGETAYVAGAGGSVRVLVEAAGDAGPTVLTDVIVFDPAFRGGGRATGLVDPGPGPDRLVVVPGVGGGAVVAAFAFDGVSMVPSYRLADPYGAEFRGGLFVSAADVDLDGRDEILLLPGEGGGPRLLALDAETLAVDADLLVGDHADRSGLTRLSPTGGFVQVPAGGRAVFVVSPDGEFAGYRLDGSPVPPAEAHF